MQPPESNYEQAKMLAHALLFCCQRLSLGLVNLIAMEYLDLMGFVVVVVPILAGFRYLPVRPPPLLRGGTIPSADDGGDSSLHLPFASSGSTQNCARTIECSRETVILNLSTYRSVLGIGRMTRLSCL